jgi:hypothetical protein
VKADALAIVSDKFVFRSRMRPVAGMVYVARGMIGADTRPIIRPFRALVLVRRNQLRPSDGKWTAPHGTLLSIGRLLVGNERDVWRANIVGRDALVDAK